MVTALIHFDGGARPNPGEGAIGYTIKMDDQNVEESKSIGQTTNNQAEYKALIGSLEEALERGVARVVVRGDSELVVKQINGEYSVNSEELRPLYEKVQRMASEFDSFEIRHVARGKNNRADSLVDEELSTQTG